MGHLNLLLIISLVLGLPTALSSGPVPQPVVRYSAPKAGLLWDAETIVLSAGSLAYDGPHPVNASIASPAACRAACAALPSCRGWSFCNGAAKGCGRGCKAYAREHPKLESAGPQAPDANAPLPILSFGPWTFPHSSSDGCQPLGFTRGDGTSDAWPFGMCMLSGTKGGGADAGEGPPVAAAAGVGEAAVAKRDAGDGWVSGTVQVPEPECSGLSAASCAACLASQRPDECLRCAKDRRARPGAEVEYLTKKAGDAQRGCALCSNVTAKMEREMCYDCILTGKQCAVCALGSTMWGTGPPDVGACLSCVHRKGQALSGECSECSQSRAPGSCFSCLDSFDLKLCKSNGGYGGYGAGNCRQPGAGPSPCSRCANAARSEAAFGRCLGCFRDPARDQECAGCGQVSEGVRDQLRCYDCVAKAAFSSWEHFGCAQCFSAWVAPEARGECLACVEDAATPQGAKRYCAVCSDTDESHAEAQGRRRCFACLQSQGKSKKGGYGAKCLAGAAGQQYGGGRRLRGWHMLF